MSKTEKMVPELRFEEFTGAWEQRKLGEVVNITMGQSPDSKNYTDNPNDHILVQGNADMKDGKVFPRVWTTQVTKKANVGDLILSVRAPVGDIGKTDFSAVIGRGVASIEGNEFIFQMLSKMKSDGFWFKLSTGSTFDSINSSDIKEAMILIPGKKEQSAIGSFFTTLDTTITYHQRKLDKLKELKRAYLQQMFPQNEEEVPKLRFANFNENWEHRKLGNYFVERSERTADGELISVTINAGVVRASTLERKDNSSKDKSNYKKVEIGDVAYNSMRMWQGASGVSSFSGILSPAYTVLTPGAEVSSLFFSYQFKLSKMIQIFQANSQGLTSDTWNLKYPILKNIKTTVPIYKEQNKIGNFFKQLDYTIALHQTKLESLKELKRAYLQKMFI